MALGPYTLFFTTVNAVLHFEQYKTARLGTSKNEIWTIQQYIVKFVMSFVAVALFLS